MENLKQQISVSWESNEFKEFENTMQALFPKENLLVEGNDRQKLKLTYSRLRAKNCTIKELRDTLNHFSDNHSRNLWMPADVIDSFNNSSQRMVM